MLHRQTHLMVLCVYFILPFININPDAKYYRGIGVIHMILTSLYVYLILPFINPKS